MKKKMKRKIKMTKLGKVIMTTIIVSVGVLLYTYSGKWGEEQTKMSIILCSISWFYLLIAQFVFIHFLWEK